MDLCEFKATLIYTRNSRPARVYKAGKPYLKKEGQQHLKGFIPPPPPEKDHHNVWATLGLLGNNVK